MTERIKKFFEQFEYAISSSNMEQVTDCYSDVFMFGNNNGTQAVKKADFIKVLPKRREVFKSAGLLSSTIKSLKEISLDENYYLVTACWEMSIKSNQQETKEIEISSTYVLYEHDSLLQIVFQLDHHDLMKRIEEAK
jgi:hypothetical protein